MILEKFSDAEAIFYALTQDESGLDLAEFLFVDSSDEGKKNHGIFRAWPFQVAWFRNKAQQHIDAAGRCIAEGQLVLTENGWIPIEEVAVGVRVLTHTGKWQKVTHVWDRGVKDVVVVKTQGHPNGVIATPDHRFYASHAKRASAPKDGHKGKKLLGEEWIAPSDFMHSDGSQIVNTHISSPRYFDYLEPDLDMQPVKHGKKTNVINDILSLDWLWLYGLFIAEGCTHRNEKFRTYRSEWSLHGDEIAAVIPYFDRLGINYNLKQSSKDASVKINVNSKPITLWLHRNAGYLSHGKDIAPWVFSLTKEQRRAVLDGYIFGDGSVRKGEDSRYGFSTVSAKLALSIRMLANSLDMSYSVWNKKAHYGWIRDEWVVGRPAFAGEMQELSKQNRNKSRNINTEKHVWLGVDSVKPVGEIRTWDLTVEEDHSFVVEGYVVHNSVGKAINVDEPILTTKGWTTMGKLKKGDYVFSEKGEPVEVLRAFSELKDRDCYKVTFDDGCEIIVDGEHNWSTYKENDVRLADHSGGVPGISVSTTVEILNTLTVDITDPDIGLKRTEFNHRVPYIDAIQFHDTNLTNSDLHRCVYRLAGFRSRRIVGVEPVESVTVRCIEVDNPTHLFLVGEGLIPTHNSMSIKFRAMAFPFIYPGEEMLITAPESSHLETVTDNFERMILKMRLMRELIDGNIKHKPFHLNWKTNSRTMGRIPQKDGHGVQGVHAMVLEHDEGAAYPESGWVELPETVQQNNPRTRWRCIADDQLVLTKNGLKKISSVEIGDLVWTHKNRWRPVVKVFDNGIADCVEVATTDGKKVISTPDHKFLMSDTGDGFNWLPVEENYENSNSPVFCVVFHSDIIQGFTLSKVESVLGVGERHVYDLEVEEDHSYVVNGMVVSNCHGVSFGFGGRFNEIISGADPNWTVTHLPAMIRPNWNEAEREKRIIEYGGYESSGYRRNILGLPSDMGSPIFPLNQLMAVIDTEEDSEYNSDVYYYASLDEGQVSDLRLANPEAPVSDLLNLPISHQNYSSIWIGMDIGWTISPSAICIFAEDAMAKKGSSGLRLIGRILLNKFSGPDQARIVTHLMRFYRPVVFAMDATGAGKPLWDFIDEQISNDEELKILRGRVKNINFSEKVIVGFDENIKIQPGKGKDAYLDAAIKRPFVEASTDSVRKLVGDGKIALPYDRDLLSELQAAPQKGASIGSTLDEYGRSGRKKGMHNLDAIRCAVFSYETKLIDQMIASHNTIWEPPDSVWF